ncbi:LTA synthase family protein [Georgenia sp. EYE_87]|uniref:LTA synthase family protein n=1 Tax=Georgenia sp. EYE_87 TaxID=2853448 RepID=UPI00200342CA|nr:LTA synthase family protein [Georgenia sp. EYE_87]MCK6212216.1 LTA synthase family protein [Georgenia sp. EYE_87]
MLQTSSATRAADVVPPTQAPDDQGPARPRRPWLRRAVDAAERAVPVTALTLAVAVVVTTVLELVHVQTDPWLPPLERVATWRTDQLALQVLVVWAAVVLIHAVLGRLWLTALVSGALGAVIAFADYQKMLMRGEPLYPTDVEYLGEAGLLLDSIGVAPGLVLAGLAAVVLAAVAVALVLRRRRSGQPRRAALTPRERVRALVPRATAGLLAVGVLATAGAFNEDGNPLRTLWERSGPDWARWNQVENYAENGFVSGVLYNMPGTAMERPDGYSEARLREVTEKYAAVAAEANASRDAGALADTNVLVVLSESFTDPTRLDGLEVAEDPIPFTRALMAQTPSGTMLSSDYGGGTANVEFEVLTGMSLSNFREQMHTPYQMLVPYEDDFPSLLRSVGADHAAIAIHPYQRSFYKRDEVYATFGFERAAFEDDMADAERVEDNPFVSDAGTFTRVVDELEASEDPMVVNVVTMQNHRPYDGKYDDPIDVEGALPPMDRREVGQYLRGLRHSDEAVAQLIADLEALDERTIVLFYGDHSPAIWSNQIWNRNPGQTMYETPWFVWANFETAPVEPVAELLGPNHLLNQLLSAANAPLTPYDALLAQIAEEVPAAERGIMLDPQGRQITAADLSPRARELLEDYRLVQYDLAVGEGWAEDELYKVPPAS